DLQPIADDAIAVLANPLIPSVIQSLLAEARQSPDLGTVLTERFIRPRREAGAQMQHRPINRGEIGPDSDLELARTSSAARCTCAASYSVKNFLRTTPRVSPESVLRSLGVHRPGARLKQIGDG